MYMALWHQIFERLKALPKSIIDGIVQYLSLIVVFSIIVCDVMVDIHVKFFQDNHVKPKNLNPM